MKQEQIEKLLFLHCSDDDLRPRMKTPYRLKDWFFATSGTTMIQVPVSLFPFTFPEDEKGPDCLRVIPGDRHDPIIWNMPKLAALIQTAPKIPYQIPCEACGGEGEQECDLGHMHECEYCYGDGYKEHSDLKVPNPDQVFVINGVAFRVEILEIIVKSASLVECENISLVWSKAERPCLFEMKEGIQMLVAPSVSFKKENVPDYIIVTETLAPENSEL